ncbi:hypothetical protein [Deinococcus pimensis]|uniref:hypothetical protein n=1 Tax=Deinococcus pimensis TaxID=309888 RepID=UPI000484231B|nr:hypothetical protein [Deinococcus pimensis]
MTFAFAAALLFFTLNFALGLSLQLGSRWHPRPLHHVLYFLTCASTALALLLTWRAHGPWIWPAALLAALLTVPRTRPGRTDHAALACVLAAGFLLTAWRLL